MPVVPGLDHAPRKHRVPHVHISHLPHKALRGFQSSKVSVRVLTQQDGPLRMDAVTGFVDLVGAALPFQPESGETRTRLPGEANAGAEGAERRQVEEDAVATQVEGDAAVLFTPHVELVVVGRAVGEQDDLPLLRQLGGYSHAEREGSEGHLLLGDQGHEAEVRLIREDQDLLTQACWG